MNKAKYSSVMIVIFSGLFFLLPMLVGAAEPNTLAPSNIPGTSEGNSLIKCGNSDVLGGRAGADKECTFNDLINLIQNIFNLVFAFAGMITAGLFMYAGFLMVTAMGNAAQITQAKAIFRRVVIGFLILFMSFILIQQTLKNLSLSPKAREIIGKFISIPTGN